MAPQVTIQDLALPTFFTDFVRSLPFPELMLGKWFPTKYVKNNEFSYDLTQLIDEPAADYRGWDTEAPIGDRQGIVYGKGELAPISKKRLLGESAGLKLRGQQYGDWQPYIDALLDDFYWLTRSIHNRWEIDRGLILSTGALPVPFRRPDGSVFTQTITYPVPANQIKTAAPLWSDTTNSDPIADVTSWLITYRANNRGANPGAMVMTSDVFSYLRRNAKIRALLAVGGAVPTVLSPSMLRAELDGNGWPEIIIVDEQVMDRTGTMVNPLATNKVTFLPPAGVPLGYTGIGVTAEAIGMVDQGHMKGEVAAGIVGTKKYQEDPAGESNRVTAVGFPIAGNAKYLMIATVA